MSNSVSGQFTYSLYPGSSVQYHLGGSFISRFSSRPVSTSGWDPVVYSMYIEQVYWVTFVGNPRCTTDSAANKLIKYTADKCVRVRFKVPLTWNGEVFLCNIIGDWERCNTRFKGNAEELLFLKIPYSRLKSQLSFELTVRFNYSSKNYYIHTCSGMAHLVIVRVRWTFQLRAEKPFLSLYRVIQKVTDKRKSWVGGTILSQEKIGLGVCIALFSS